MASDITFHHPLIPVPLEVAVSPDQITWAYGLNTASFPTYGGEVVQILSVYIDDMTISGTVSTYKEMEQIYGWFIAYMQFATQGRDLRHFNQQPVTVHYVPRGWTFQIWPKSLPGFRYGRDVVAPTWSLTAAVYERDEDFQQQLMADQLKKLSTEGPISTFGVTTADFATTGDLEHNPWASADADPGRKGETVASYLSGQTKNLADTFASWVTDFNDQQLSNLPELQAVSKLAGDPGGSSTPTKKAGKVKHK